MSVTSTLALEVGAFGGVTRLVRSRQQFPQRVTVPMYLDADRAIAYLCVQNPAAGIFPGDRFRVEGRVGRDSGMHLTGAAATQVFSDRTDGSEPHPAVQEYDFELEQDAYLEQVPKRTIPHAGSVFHQRTTVRMHPRAAYVGWESVASGRVGHGERNRFVEYAALTDVEIAGRTTVKESIRLRPLRHHTSARGILAGHDYAGTLLIVAPSADLDALGARLLEVVAAASGERAVVAAVSTLPSAAGLICRVLACRAPALDRLLRSLLSEVRSALTGSALPALRM